MLSDSSGWIFMLSSSAGPPYRVSVLWCLQSSLQDIRCCLRSYILLPVTVLIFTLCHLGKNKTLIKSLSVSVCVCFWLFYQTSHKELVKVLRTTSIYDVRGRNSTTRQLLTGFMWMTGFTSKILWFLKTGVNLCLWNNPEIMIYENKKILLEWQKGGALWRLGELLHPSEQNHLEGCDFLKIQRYLNWIKWHGNTSAPATHRCCLIIISVVTFQSNLSNIYISSHL